MDTTLVSSIHSAHPPLTSIILVSFYTGPALFQTINSIAAQTAPFEIIIIDNGNPPDAMEQLRVMATQDARIKIITGHGNIGFGRANNLGVAASKGEYILILNPDCLLPDSAVTELYKQAEGLKHPFMIGARIVNEDGSDQRGCRREILTPKTAFVEALHLGRLFPRIRLNRHEEAMPEIITPIPAISGAFMFLSRKDYDLIGGFDEAYFLHVEDLDFCVRFHRAKGTIYFAPDIKVIHIGGTSDVTSDFIEKHKAKGFIRYFHRNFGSIYPLPFLWCLDIAIWVRYLVRRYLNPSIK